MSRIVISSDAFPGKYDRVYYVDNEGNHTDISDAVNGYVIKYRAGKPRTVDLHVIAELVMSGSYDVEVVMSGSYD